MTSPSLRNRRTTRSSTRLQNYCSIAGLCCLVVLIAVGLAVGQSDRQQSDDLLNGLKSRSVESRWNLLKKQPPAPPAPASSEPVRSLFDRRPITANELQPELPPPQLPQVRTETPYPTPSIARPHPGFVEPGTPQPGRTFSALPIDPLNLGDPSKRDDEHLLRPVTDIAPSRKYLPKSLRGRTATAPRGNWQKQPEPQRRLEGIVYQWEASNVSHNPLYFEDPALERYGHTFPDYAQPFVSIGRFGAQLIGLPYQMAIDPLCKEVYPLGWYAPGECAPQLLYQVPWNAEASGVEAGVLLGLMFLIP